MPLTENQKLQTLRTDTRVKRSYPADAGTYYVGERIMVGPASNTAKPISGSAESGVQIVGIVCKQQTVAQGEYLEVEAGPFVLSGSGFTNKDTNKPAYADSSTIVYSAHAAGRHLLGRFRGFTVVGNGSSNAVFDVGLHVSGSTF